MQIFYLRINPLKAELNPICRLLALLGAHLIFHFSGLRFNPVLFDRTLSFATVTVRKNRQQYFHKCWVSKYLRRQWCYGISRSYPVLFLKEPSDITTSLNLQLHSEHNSRDLLKITSSFPAKNTTPDFTLPKQDFCKRSWYIAIRRVPATWPQYSV